MKYAYALIFFALLLVGCGDAFTGTDAGTGGTAGFGGNTGGSAGSTGGSAGHAGSAGHGGNTGGSSGSGGNAGEGGSGGSNPCPDATYDQVAAEIGQPCANLFPAGCGTQNPVPRAEFITVIIDQVPEKLEGFVPPGTATFSDVPLGHPAFSAVEAAVWLDLVPVTAAFHPDDPVTTCFAQEVTDVMAELPSIYAIVESCEPDQNLGVSSGPVLACSFTLYGTNSGNHLTQTVTVSNSLAGDYTVPESTSALEAVRFRCEVPAGGSYTTYTLPLTNGSADFSTLDCFSQAGAPMQIQIQVDPVAAGQARIGIDPTTLTIRGAGQADNPVFTIQ